MTADFLPPQMRKHVDPAAPVPLRMMAAKSLVPLSPSDMLGALFMLTFDADATVRETAARTAAALPDRIASSALRDEGVQAPVLGYFLSVLGGNEAYAETLVLNPTTPDVAVAAVARTCSLRVAEIIGENQLRVLRHDDIVRQLCQNPHVTPALVDRVCDFGVRNGLILRDVPQMQAARVRIFGPQAAAQPPDPGPTAEEVLRDFRDEVLSEGAAPMEEGKKLTLTQRVMKMSTAERIKLATLGNKEARSILLRDSNKLVAMAAIRSPRVTDAEVLAQAYNKSAHDDVLRAIYGNKEWIKEYTIKLALVKNPKVPVAITMRFLSTLRESDVKDLAKNKNVAQGVQVMARRMVEKKGAPRRDEK
ncbi:MAG: hypothetical protein L0Y64_10035 [Myxococcaceae bacterium]|nr:hypothetical protein [Myxococcaceae bacterium]